MPARSLLLACLVALVVVAVFTGCPKKTAVENASPPVNLLQGKEPPATENAAEPAPNAEEPAANAEATENAGEASAAPPEDGMALADTKCAKCHTTDRVAKDPGDEAHWTGIVKDMQAKDPAWISDAEAAEIAAALAAKYPGA